MKKYLNAIFTDLASRLTYIKPDMLFYDIPKFENQGDLSSNVAMLCAKTEKRRPREIAEEIRAKLTFDKSIIEKIEIAGPGFINFFFNPSFVCKVVIDILANVDNFGKSNKNQNKGANVEFVSANPTGPLTVGHGRNAVIGDTIANLLEWTGYKVEREYYFNNAGRQMRVLGDSVRLRYFEILGETVAFPETYYQGAYIKDIASGLFSKYGNELVNEEAEGKFKEAAEKEIFSDIVKTLKTILIEHKTFYNENSLYSEGKIDNAIEIFNSKNLVYEKDGAKWLKLSELGAGQDKVIVKSSGEPTYRLPDIAYHITKFERGYDLIVDLFGSDHNATYPDVLAALKSLNYDIDKIKVLIHQFVTIMQNGEIVKMSTRKANYITLDQLIEAAGADVVRYFFCMRTISSHLNFDLAIATKQSDENPVFYMQYAHARICSILRLAEEQNIKYNTENLSLLTGAEEQKLLRKLREFESEVIYAADNFEPSRICTYLESLAADFHRFYRECRIIGSEIKLAEARLALAVASKIVIRNGLSILGVSAPDKM